MSTKTGFLPLSRGVKIRFGSNELQNFSWLAFLGKSVNLVVISFLEPIHKELPFLSYLLLFHLIVLEFSDYLHLCMLLLHSKSVECVKCINCNKSIKYAKRVLWNIYLPLSNAFPQHHLPQLLQLLRNPHLVDSL